MFFADLFCCLKKPKRALVISDPILDPRYPSLIEAATRYAEPKPVERPRSRDSMYRDVCAQLEHLSVYADAGHPMAQATPQKPLPPKPSKLSRFVSWQRLVPPKMADHHPRGKPAPNLRVEAIKRAAKKFGCKKRDTQRPMSLRHPDHPLQARRRLASLSISIERD